MNYGIKEDVKNQPWEDTEKTWAPNGIRTHDPLCSLMVDSLNRILSPLLYNMSKVMSETTRKQ